MTLGHAQTGTAPHRPAWELSATLRGVLMLAPPLAVAVLEVFHPQPDETGKP